MFTSHRYAENSPGPAAWFPVAFEPPHFLVSPPLAAKAEKPPAVSPLSGSSFHQPFLLCQKGAEDSAPFWFLLWNFPGMSPRKILFVNFLSNFSKPLVFGKKSEYDGSELESVVFGSNLLY